MSPQEEFASERLTFRLGVAEDAAILLDRLDCREVGHFGPGGSHAARLPVGEQATLSPSPTEMTPSPNQTAGLFGGHALSLPACG